MSKLDEVGEIENAPAQIRFERVLVDDTVETAKQGHYVAKEVHLVHVKVPGSLDIWKQKVPQWFALKALDVQNDRMPQKWLDAYKAAYEQWKKGQEVPLHGMPIKGWGVISPAQQEALIRINVLTVEELSNINDEGMRRIGLGALHLKNKAVAALKAAKDTGTLVMENAALKSRVEISEANQAEMMKKVEALEAQMRVPHAPQQLDSGITASDILEEPESVLTIEAKYEAKYGKPPHHRMKPETIEAALKE